MRFTKIKTKTIYLKFFLSLFKASGPLKKKFAAFSGYKDVKVYRHDFLLRTLSGWVPPSKFFHMGFYCVLSFLHGKPSSWVSLISVSARIRWLYCICSVLSTVKASIKPPVRLFNFRGSRRRLIREESLLERVS